MSNPLIIEEKSAENSQDPWSANDQTKNAVTCEADDCATECAERSKNLHGA